MDKSFILFIISGLLIFAVMPSALYFVMSTVTKGNAYLSSIAVIAYYAGLVTQFLLLYKNSKEES